ncbi:hypothetical protein [Fulvivirga sp.]|uniref:hypothetical protein n=1 Tax=Fulvivirga sp. TaxID=1931237 RepID=UPI0032EC5B6D
MIRTLKYQLILILALCLAVMEGFAQQKTDTLIVNVGKSKIIFLIEDKADLEQMEKYDLNEILQSLKMKLNGDSTLVSDNGSEETVIGDTTVVVENNNDDDYNYSDDSYSNDDYKASDNRWRNEERYRSRGTRNMINFDFGTNNYLNGDGKFADEDNEAYAVRPWGSWYFGINSIYQTSLAKRFYIEWGPGISWYNFKFQNSRTRITEIGDQTIFLEDPDMEVDYKKSKLTATFINFTAVPMVNFGNPKRRSRNFKNWDEINFGQPDAGFRIGVGGYAGYRLGSHAKVKYKGGKKDKDRDNFNLTNLRYGVRLQMGFRGTDLFFNYDLNELFAEDKGPKLNAFSFGIIL